MWVAEVEDQFTMTKRERRRPPRGSSHQILA
jgi:hypothetical protein